jgi:hypothetical protein
VSRDAARNAALITNDLSKAAWLSSVENSSESHVERGNPKARTAENYVKRQYIQWYSILGAIRSPSPDLKCTLLPFSWLKLCHVMSVPDSDLSNYLSRDPLGRGLVISHLR